MPSEYAELRELDYFVTGTRVTLDCVVYGFLRGESPEAIREDFPVLTLEEVYGAIAYYLGHKAEIDEYLRVGEAQFEEARRAQGIPADLQARLDRAREQRLHRT